MTRDTLLRIGVGALIVAAGIWLANATEWVEVQEPTPARGQAQRDNFFAAELLLRRLGAQVERRQALEELPPPRARLVLHSLHWDLFPERATRLRRWVEGGGHLVVPATIAADPLLAEWIAVLVERPDGRRGDRAREALRNRLPPQERHCRQLAESAGVTPAYADLTEYRVCVQPYWSELKPDGRVVPQWLLQGPQGIEFLRVPVGRGSVTVHAPPGIMSNQEILRSDHGLAVIAALQLQPGAPVWLVTEESRAPLLVWVWQHGAAAVLLLALAAGLWVWRSTVRFGPVGDVAPPLRRSMKEQVTGTGSFLQHQAPAALLAAQVRALREAARIRLPGYAGLAEPAAGAAVARATGLDAAALQDAADPASVRPRNLPARLELLETARRRLNQITH